MSTSAVRYIPNLNISSTNLIWMDIWVPFHPHRFRCPPSLRLRLLPLFWQLLVHLPAILLITNSKVINRAMIVSDEYVQLNFKKLGLILNVRYIFFIVLFWSNPPQGTTPIKVSSESSTPMVSPVSSSAVGMPTILNRPTINQNQLPHQPHAHVSMPYVWSTPS